MAGLEKARLNELQLARLERDRGNVVVVLYPKIAGRCHHLGLNREEGVRVVTRERDLFGIKIDTLIVADLLGEIDPKTVLAASARMRDNVEAKIIEMVDGDQCRVTMEGGVWK